MPRPQEPTTQDPRRDAAGRETRTLRRFTAASAGIHALILLGFVIIPMSRPEKPIFAEPIYEVAMFEGAPNYEAPKPVRVDPDPPRPAVEKPDEAPKPRETVPVPPETPKPKPGKKPDPVPEKKPDPKPQKPKPDPPQPDKQRKPPARIEDVQKQDPPAEKVPEIKSAPRDEPVSLGMVDQKDFKQSYYLDSIRLLLSREWAKSPLNVTTVMRTGIHFVIRRDGSIESPEIVSSSGSPIHDRAAMAALKRVGKFPPLPEDYAGEILSPTANFVTGDR